MGLMAFHASLLLTAVALRKNANLQFFLLFLACEFSFFFCLFLSVCLISGIVSKFTGKMG
jgi:hypothetical protein